MILATGKTPVVDMVINVKSAATGQTKTYTLTGTAVIQPKDTKDGSHNLK